MKLSEKQYLDSQFYSKTTKADADRAMFRVTAMKEFERIYPQKLFDFVDSVINQNSGGISYEDVAEKMGIIKDTLADLFGPEYERCIAEAESYVETDEIRHNDYLRSLQGKI